MEIGVFCVTLCRSFQIRLFNYSSFPQKCRYMKVRNDTQEEALAVSEVKPEEAERAVQLQREAVIILR